jgi:hypothetical protein
MIDESEKMVLDTEGKLNKATGELKDLVVSFPSSPRELGLIRLSYDRNE